MTTLTSEQICQLTGLSLRQLNHLVDSGVLEEPRTSRGSGFPRCWMPEQVRLIQVLAKLRSVGADVFVLRAVANEMCWWPIEQWEGPVFVSLDGSASRQLSSEAAWVLDLSALPSLEAVAA